MAKPKKTESNASHPHAIRSKFLVYVDESEDSITALRYACTKAKYRKRPVDILYVINPEDYNTIFSVAEVMKEEREKEAKALLRKLARMAEETSGVKPTTLLREGLALEEIIAQVEEDHDINMLIISSNPSAASGGSKLLTSLAAIADDPLHIPILIVPAHLTDQQIEELN